MKKKQKDPLLSGELYFVTSHMFNLFFLLCISRIIVLVLFFFRLLFFLYFVIQKKC